MRSLRSVKKSKKYKKLIVFAQILAIWYASILSLSLVTSDTVAYFNDPKKTSFSIQSGTWWDGSKLTFVKHNTENIKSCEPNSITAQIKNEGFDMMDATEYEVVYWPTDNRNPQHKGDVIYEGVIDPIGKNEIVTLQFEAEKEGSYKFKAYQRPGFNDNYDTREAIWSHKIMMNCKGKQEKEANSDVAEEVEESKEEVEFIEKEENVEAPIIEEEEVNRKEEKEESAENSKEEATEKSVNEKEKEVIETSSDDSLEEIVNSQSEKEGEDE
ncbi:amyloid fiber anchoring/assembly protein TapA [Alkalihalobacterium bogoriense]|uniref:amyloid fiber anchoring/assembly protein TapA n=1 Tax=Alkalihalobacterium bogoriense TaxID=246272 RepID=UPI000478C2CF|nr:amyloid fiber anchoring/assembly protein TapA [Alkalihalobacterium bogoriense]